ncbi:MAG TPA: hypothetical protein DEP42_04440 [Ruminococcaceae bacterium]|nr:hypothetical protein [Oscillospiraceae bacterium]
MTAKEFLNQYLEADRSVDNKLKEITQLRELATKTTSALSSNGSHAQNSKPDKLADICAKIVDAENEVDKRIDMLLEIKQQVLSVIDGVRDARYREVLERRYIHGQKWERIATDMHFDYRWVLQLHGHALQVITEI